MCHTAVLVNFDKKKHIENIKKYLSKYLLGFFIARLDIGLCYNLDIVLYPLVMADNIKNINELQCEQHLHCRGNPKLFEEIH